MADSLSGGGGRRRSTNAVGAGVRRVLPKNIGGMVAGCLFGRSGGRIGLESLHTGAAMHFDAHQPVIDDLEARIVTIRDSL